MLDEAVRVLGFLQDYGDRLVADIAPEDFCRQPVPGMNHPAWIIGHLAYTADRHAMFVGLEHKLASWRDRFRKGSEIAPDPSGHPGKSELLQAWHDANARLIVSVRSASPKMLTAQNEYLRPELLPTVGDFLTYSMTSHTSMHLGQLSAWRRADGRPVLF